MLYPKPYFLLHNFINIYLKINKNTRYEIKWCQMYRKFNQSTVSHGCSRL
jgi:hypothetical protein